MKNDFYFLILFSILCLTSCEHKPDASETSGSYVTDRPGEDSSLTTKEQVIGNLPIDDSSRFHFFVENPAGTSNYQRFDFNQNRWHQVDFLFQEPFIGGPLHSGRLVQHKNLWRDSAWFFLYAQQIDRGMVLEVEPLALVEINNDPLRSVYIMIPASEEFRPSTCTSFDDWFTRCNDQRFFVQFWIEQQFFPRNIQRIQWKPLNSSAME